MQQWEEDDVRHWLQITSKGKFSRFADNFVREDITGEVLTHLTDEHLCQLGMSSDEMRESFRAAVRLLSKDKDFQPDALAHAREQIKDAQSALTKALQTVKRCEQDVMKVKALEKRIPNTPTFVRRQDRDGPPDNFVLTATVGRVGKC